jgi:ferritin-like protein
VVQQLMDAERNMGAKEQNQVQDVLTAASAQIVTLKYYNIFKF